MSRIRNHEDNNKEQKEEKFASGRTVDVEVEVISRQSFLSVGDEDRLVLKKICQSHYL